MTSAAAGRLQLKLKPLCDALFCEVNPIPVKTALNLMGLEAGELRLPLCPPTDASVERLKLALSIVGSAAGADLLSSFSREKCRCSHEQRH